MKEPFMVGCQISNDPEEVFGQPGDRPYRIFKSGPIDTYTFTFSDNTDISYKVDNRKPLNTFNIIVKELAKTFVIERKPWPKGQISIVLDVMEQLVKEKKL